MGSTCDLHDCVQISFVCAEALYGLNKRVCVTVSVFLLFVQKGCMGSTSEFV